MYYFESKLDGVDAAILERLMRDGRATWADLAVDLGLTAPAIAGRVRRLEDRGIIRHFAAWIDPAYVTPVSAFISVSLSKPDGHEHLRKSISQSDAIQECHQTAADDEYLLKVRCASIAALAELVNSLHSKLGTGTRLKTSVILATIKESPVLPVPKTQE
jgi:Lrp/AsnC family leucine-responsive transcriptional regulator